MKIELRIKTLMTVLILIIAGFFAGTAMCQEINLDKMKKLEGLVCYQSLKDPSSWYYLPDQPRLAMKNGKPQFSFMKYSRTQKIGKAGTNKAEGGGIVHFLVTYGASKNRVKAAERELQEKFPDAHIEAPIVYRKGSFALITSFQEDQETLVKTVAIGKAPLMEGQKAAVSMALSREGAQLLWESFKSDTPDISLVFDMEFAGVREPYEARIEADWSRISKHKRLKAGMKYSWFGADVDMLFQELRQDGAIKITTKGENASMDKIVQSAHAKLLQVMFDPAPVDDLSKAAAQKDSYSSLNQAMKLLNSSKGKKSSLNLNSPGFKQMMASIIGLMVTDAYADAPELPPLPEENSTETSPSGQQNAKLITQTADEDIARELPAEDRVTLREHFQEGLELVNAGEYQAAIEIFYECDKIHEELVGRIAPGGTLNKNIAFCEMKLERYMGAATTYILAAEGYGRDTEKGKQCLKESERAMQLGADKILKENKISEPDKKPPTESASDAYNTARRLDDKAKQGGYKPLATQEAVSAYEEYKRSYSPTGTRAKEIEGRLRSLKKRLASSDKGKTSDSAIRTANTRQTEEKPPATVSQSDKKTSPSTLGKNSTVSSKSQSDQGRKSASSGKKTSTPSTDKVKKPSSSNKRPSAVGKRVSQKKPGFSFVASYQMKNIKRSGRMVYQMNHFRSEKQNFTMTENIGPLYSRYKNDKKIFKAVTIDDPVFKLREILVTLDGQDTSTFTKYLNFVTVKMSKRHESGAVTNDEVVITPETFNRNSNSFSLAYGYHDDTNRNKWLEYQYQVIWSFHGGVEIRSEWNKENNPMLALYPPYRYRSLTIEGEGDQLQQAEVRHAVVAINSWINGKKITTTATIRNQGPSPVLHLDIPEGISEEPGDVSITWYLKGGKKVKSSLQKLEGDIIYWDELPSKGRS